MNESEKLYHWLEISAYPEQAEIVKKMIDKEKKLLEFVTSIFVYHSPGERLVSDYQQGWLDHVDQITDEAEKILKEVGDL